MQGTHLDGVLVLAGEGVDSALLDTLLTLAKALVPKDQWVSRSIRDGEEDVKTRIGPAGGSKELGDVLSNSHCESVYLCVS